MGVNLARTKTLVFGVSAAMCALVGSLFAHRRQPGEPGAAQLHPHRQHHLRARDGARRCGHALGADRWRDRLRLPRDHDARGGRRAVPTRARWPTSPTGCSAGSPARRRSLILAIVLLIMMFVAPFGIVGLCAAWPPTCVHIVPRRRVAGVVCSPQGRPSPTSSSSQPIRSIRSVEHRPVNHRGRSMSSRSARVTALVGACAIAGSAVAAGAAHATTASPSGGWTVDTEQLLRPRPRPTRRSRARSASARRCRCPAAPRPPRSRRPPRGSRRTSTTPTSKACCPATSSSSTIGDDQYDAGAHAGRGQRLIDDGVDLFAGDHRHADEPRRARHAQRGVHPAAQPAHAATRRGARPRTTRGRPAC